MKTGRLNANAFRWLLLAALTTTMVLALGGVLGVRLNMTHSLPNGFYLITDDTNASLVEFCPEGQFARLSAARGYRTRGICPDGAAPILKPVVARPGDTVEVSPEGIRVNGTLLPKTAPQSVDSAGRPLTAWPTGLYHVRPGSLWVASTYHPDSFDSRYFGPIRAEIVRHRLKPLWVFSTAKRTK